MDKETYDKVNAIYMAGPSPNAGNVAQEAAASAAALLASLTDGIPANSALSQVLQRIGTSRQIVLNAGVNAGAAPTWNAWMHNLVPPSATEGQVLALKSELAATRETLAEEQQKAKELRRKARQQRELTREAKGYAEEMTEAIRQVLMENAFLRQQNRLLLAEVISEPQEYDIDPDEFNELNRN